VDDIGNPTPYFNPPAPPPPEYEPPPPPPATTKYSTFAVKLGVNVPEVVNV
jgi:hypothetical protein